MHSHPFFIVDVFAESKYTGNQLAVVRHADDLSEAEMQRIAREMHFAETSFILSDREREGGYDVRIFTSEVQVPFAGHPTLGTAFVIREEIVRNPVATVSLNLAVGKIPVSFDGSLLWMKQFAPSLGKPYDADQVAKALGLMTEDIDTRFPIQEVSTGLPILIVPLRNLGAIKRAKNNRTSLRELLDGMASEGVLLFAPETYSPENQLNVRVFFLEIAVPEDPATGSAAGCLAGYLIKTRYFGGREIDLRVEQGYEIRRPSLLQLRATESAESIDVNVGGQVFLVARGELV